MIIQERVSIAPFTTFKIGGVARYFAQVTSKDDLARVLDFCQNRSIPFIVLGKGSNTLFSDTGLYDGMVIVSKLNDYSLEGNRVFVGSGYNFSLLGAKTAKMGLGGLEFACGIPGSVGGAICMNAGAGGSEVANVIESVEYFDGHFKTIARDECGFAYRSSCFQKREGIIVGGVFQLHQKEEARVLQREILQRRLASQPYEAKTAGCCFRNPEGHSAGALIDACGLKGKSVGGARVSPKHANFIENHSGASSEDVVNLIALIQKTVYEKKGIKLELEVKVLGTPTISR